MIDEWAELKWAVLNQQQNFGDGASLKSVIK